MTAPVWIATPGGAAYCATPAKPATQKNSAKEDSRK
jgi:hypothetical protein